MEQGKTIAEMLEDARRRSGAAVCHGHDIMDLARFAEDTRHMIVFDVLNNECRFGFRGERTRLFITEEGYKVALDSAEKGQIKILNHAHVQNGHLRYDHHDQVL